jgi:hypothetical protein
MSSATKASSAWPEEVSRIIADNLRPAELHV